MKSNNNHKSKPIQPRQASTMRTFLWIVYKWALIGLSIFCCYCLLHFLPEFDYFELIPCLAVTVLFAEIIRHHAALKNIAENPNPQHLQEENSSIGYVLSWVMYIGLYLYSIFPFDLMYRKMSSKPYLVFLIVMYGVVPVLYNFLFLTE